MDPVALTFSSWGPTPAEKKPSAILNNINLNYRTEQFAFTQITSFPDYCELHYRFTVYKKL